MPFPNPFQNVPNPFTGIDNPLPDVPSFSFPVPKPEEWPQKAKDFVRGLIDAAIAPGVGVIVGAYFLYLETQAEGKLKPIPDPLRSWLQPHYNIGLNEIYYAENIDTVHGQAITVEDHIYFPSAVNLSKCDDACWIMHEIEHSVQYRTMGGKVPFVAKYAAQIATNIIQTQSFDVHDVLDIEADADAKADGLKNEICTKLAQIANPIAPQVPASNWLHAVLASLD